MKLRITLVQMSKNKKVEFKDLENKVHQFRRSWDIRPDPLNKENPYHPINIETYKHIPFKSIPNTESLKDTYNRVIKFYKKALSNNPRIYDRNFFRVIIKYIVFFILNFIG